MVPADLVHFTAAEFRQPDLMDPEFCYALDAVRSRYGSPLTITSDARTLTEELALPAHAEPPESSLHVANPLARAVDLAWIADAEARWRFQEAVCDTEKSLHLSVELEYEGPGEPHIHFGLFRDARPSRLLFTYYGG